MPLTKKKILLLTPLIIIGVRLIFTWIEYLQNQFVARWNHWLALALFIVLIVLFLKDFKKAILATGIYLILGTFNLLILTPAKNTTSFGVTIGPLELMTPGFQLLSFGILALFCTLNFDTLVNMYLDYKEAKQIKRS